MALDDTAKLGVPLRDCIFTMVKSSEYYFIFDTCINKKVVPQPEPAAELPRPKKKHRGSFRGLQIYSELRNNLEKISRDRSQPIPARSLSLTEVKFLFIPLQLLTPFAVKFTCKNISCLGKPRIEATELRPTSCLQTSELQQFCCSLHYNR